MSDDSGFIVPPGLSSYFDQMMPDALRYFESLKPVGAMPAGEWAQNTSDSEPTRILKAASFIQVPDELLMDAGVIPDTREHKPVPWRWRLRWRINDWRECAAGLAYRLISGHDMPDMEE